MSGGAFNYKQHAITDIADTIEEYIINEVGGTEFPIVLERMREAVKTLREAHVMAHRIDWLLSGDDGTESFLRRWDEDLRIVRGANAKSIS